MTRPSRTEALARALQKRDAAEYGPVIDGVQHPVWDDLGPDGHEQYLADAKYAIDSLKIIDRIQCELDADAEGKAYARAEEHDVSDCD